MTLDLALDVHGDLGEAFALAGSCEGTEAMVLLWLRILLTRPGSAPLDRQRGSSLLAMLGGGFLADGNAQAMVAVAVAEATQQLLALQKQRQLARAEQIADVALIAVELLRTASQSTLSMTVQFVTREGRAYLLPVKVTP